MTGMFGYHTFCSPTVQPYTRQHAGVTPYRMLYGREARIPVDLLVEGVTASDEVPTDVPTYLQKMKGMFERAYDMARTKLKKSTQRYKDYYDRKANGKSFKVGDKVWLFQPHSRKRISRKLSRSWEGPYTAVSIIRCCLPHTEGWEG